MGYDVTVNRLGLEFNNIEYTVQLSPHRPIAANMQADYEAKNQPRRAYSTAAIPSKKLTMWL